jgi:hypothetical protein
MNENKKMKKVVIDEFVKYPNKKVLEKVDRMIEEFKAISRDKNIGATFI